MYFFGPSSSGGHHAYEGVEAFCGVRGLFRDHFTLFFGSVICGLSGDVRGLSRVVEESVNDRACYGA